MHRAKKMVALLALLLVAVLPAAALDVLGTKPAHVWGGPSSVPNEQAITQAIWAPGIDDGYVPQGLSVAEDQVLVAGYRSADPKVGQGPCRVWAIEMATGRTTGQFDLPGDCGHAGGLAYAGGDVLIVSDTRRLYKIDMKRAFQDGKADQALLATLRLAGELKGSFVDVREGVLFIGSSEKDEEKARGFFLPLALFETHGGATIREDAATSVIRIGVDAQGAAFDAQGQLWLTFSNSKWGRLRKLDPRSGQVLAEHEMVIGMEDIGFDARGRLWSVSEAGSQRWSRWNKVFPVVFALGMGRLQ
jgi:hypothetical protein